METYKWLARYYDHLTEFRRPLQRARKVVIGGILPEVRSACDLCCGTGTTAIEFAQKGIRTFAVDLSPEMCRIAREKARQSGVAIRVFQADMRDFRLPQQVDLITCEFDALNHVPRRNDLKRVLRAVAKALTPGGHFSFDVNNRAAFEHIWTTTWFIDRDPVAAVMRAGHKPGTDRAHTNIDWFVHEGECWRRYHEYVEEVCWTATEIRAALAAAGFDRIRSWDAAPFLRDGHTRRGYRTFWRTRKRPM